MVMDIITSTYQNFTDIESLKSFYSLMGRFPNFECHLDYECFHDSGYSTLGYHSKGYLFEFEDSCEVVVGSSNITRYALLKNIEWDVVVSDPLVYSQAMAEFDDKVLEFGIYCKCSYPLFHTHTGFLTSVNLFQRFQREYGKIIRRNHFTGQMIGKAVFQIRSNFLELLDKSLAVDLYAVVGQHGFL